MEFWWWELINGLISEHVRTPTCFDQLCVLLKNHRKRRLSIPLSHLHFPPHNSPVQPPPLNRTGRNPYRRPTPPSLFHIVSTLIPLPPTLPACNEELTLFLLLRLRRLLSRRPTSSNRARARRGRRRASSATDVQQQVFDVFAVEGFGEERAPDGLDVGDFGGCYQGLEFVGLLRWREWCQCGLLGGFLEKGGEEMRTVISTLSSARMSAA